MKFDNDTIRKVTKLVAYHDYRMEPTGANVRRAMHEIGVELFPYYLAVRLADTKAQSSYERRGKLENIIQIRELYRNALRNKECVTFKRSGSDRNGSDQSRNSAGKRTGNALK